MLHGSITQSHGSMICSNAVEESPGPPKAHGTHRTLGHAVRNRNENPSRRRKAQKRNSSDLAQQRGANDTGGNVKPLQHQFSVKPQPRTTDYCPLTEPLYPNRTLQLLRSGQFTHSLRGLFNMLVGTPLVDITTLRLCFQEQHRTQCLRKPACRRSFLNGCRPD